MTTHDDDSKQRPREMPNAHRDSPQVGRSREDSASTHGRQQTEGATSWAFWTWVGIATIAVLFALFASTQPGAGHFWIWWEVAGAGSAALYAAIFYVAGFFLPPRMFHHEHMESLPWVGVVIILGGSAFLLIAAATFFSWVEWDCRLQVTCILLGSFCFLLLDMTMFWKSKISGVRQDFLLSVLYNDIPVVIGFAGLLLFAIFYSGNAIGQPPAVRAFIGGAIAFQMLMSNTIFAAVFFRPGLPQAISDDTE